MLAQYREVISFASSWAGVLSASSVCHENPSLKSRLLQLQFRH